MKRIAMMLMLCAMVLPVLAEKNVGKAPEVFCIYTEKGAKTNHFAASGWMGDFGDLKLDEGWKTNPHSGQTCIRWVYNAEGKQGANWAGVFWQQPANNWGEKSGGFNLAGMKRLTFWARGQAGNEVINEFKVGGITGEHGDSDAANMGPVTLTKEWKKYEIELADKDLTHIIGGFAWATSKDVNPDGFTIYLDDIQYEK